MQLTNYPDLLGYSRQTRATAQLRERLQTTATEAVTGLKSDLTKATNGEVGRAHLLGKALNDVDQGLQINTLSKTRVTLMTNALSGADTAINGLGPRGSVAVAIGNDITLKALSNEASGTLESVMSALSTSQGPRNLFSGSKTDAPTYADPKILLEDVKDILSNASSVDDANTKLDRYFNDPDGTFETKIYTGSQNNAAPLQIGNNKSVNLDLKGNNQDIKDTLRGLAVMANAFEFTGTGREDDFDAMYSAGAASVSSGTTGLTNQQAKLGLLSATLNQAESRFNVERTSLTNAYTEMFGRDQFEATTELKTLQVQLEASYTLTARLSDLTLTNYLR